MNDLIVVAQHLTQAKYVMKKLGVRPLQCPSLYCYVPSMGERQFLGRVYKKIVLVDGWWLSCKVREARYFWQTVLQQESRGAIIIELFERDYNGELI